MTEPPPPQPPIAVVQVMPAPKPAAIDAETLLFIDNWNKRGWNRRLRCFPGLLDQPGAAHE